VTIIGVDPGKLGGIAVLDGPAGAAAVYPMPLVVSGQARNEYDLPGVVRLLQASGGGLLRGPVMVFLERGQPLPPKMGGTAANYHRGYARGLFEAMCTALGIPYELVTPRRWQGAMLAGTSGHDTKQRSIIAAQRLFPLVSLLPSLRSRKASDGLADALLIAAYGQRVAGAGPNVARLPA
jgi:hypothetical protein